jgi:hypothetical protein
VVNVVPGYGSGELLQILQTRVLGLLVCRGEVREAPVSQRRAASMRSITLARVFPPRRWTTRQAQRCLRLWNARNCDRA